MKIVIGLVALVLLLIGVVQMFNDSWGAGLLFFGLGILALHLVPDDGGLRHRGSIHFFD